MSKGGYGWVAEIYKGFVSVSHEKGQMGVYIAFRWDCFSLREFDLRRVPLTDPSRTGCLFHFTISHIVTLSFIHYKLTW